MGTLKAEAALRRRRCGGATLRVPREAVPYVRRRLRRREGDAGAGEPGLFGNTRRDARNASTSSWVYLTRTPIFTCWIDRMLCRTQSADMAILRANSSCPKAGSGAACSIPQQR